MDALERAKAGLQFEDVCQQRVEAWLEEDFDPRFDVDPQANQVQFKHHVVQSRLIEVSGEQGDFDLFRVVIEVGARLVPSPEEKDRHLTLALIEAKYRVDYRITDPGLKDDKEALACFALQNASYHVWPFWREFLMSQGMRMNLPKVPLPLKVISSPQPEKMPGS